MLTPNKYLKEIGIDENFWLFKDAKSGDERFMPDEDGFVFDLCENMGKSVILTEIDKNSKIFLSSISPTTLIKRICDEKK